MTLTQWLLTGLAAWSMLAFIIVILNVGKPREPITHRVAVGALVITVAQLAVIAMAIRGL